MKTRVVLLIALCSMACGQRPTAEADAETAGIGRPSLSAATAISSPRSVPTSPPLPTSPSPRASQASEESRAPTLTQGIRERQVPSVIGLSMVEARSVLAQAGFGMTSWCGACEDETLAVLGQSPWPGWETTEEIAVDVTAEGVDEESAVFTMSPAGARAALEAADQALRRRGIEGTVRRIGLAETSDGKGPCGRDRCVEIRYGAGSASAWALVLPGPTPRAVAARLSTEPDRLLNLKSPDEMTRLAGLAPDVRALLGGRVAVGYPLGGTDLRPECQPGGTNVCQLVMLHPEVGEPVLAVVNFVTGKAWLASIQPE